LDTTLKIALYGATLSTIGLLIHYFNYFRDRADVKIKITDREETWPSSDNDDIMEDFICINVVNRGRRPVIISSCAIRVLNKPKTDIKLLPGYIHIREKVSLDEGEIHTYFGSKQELKGYNLDKKDLLIYAVDTKDKYYWSDIFIIRWFKLRRCKRKIKKKN